MLFSNIYYNILGDISKLSKLPWAGYSAGKIHLKDVTEQSGNWEMNSASGEKLVGWMTEIMKC